MDVNSAVATIAYMSPERIGTAINRGSYDGYAGDIWSLGVSVLEVYLGRFPFGVAGDWSSLFCAICMAKPPQVPPSASPELRHFVTCCLQRDPARRWTAEKLLQHPFILMSMEKIKDEAGQQPVDMETSDRNYAIAAVQNVVGIDDRAKQITNLLEMEVNDEVRIIGIYGIDGIGKTTLAKAVYKRISSCFDSCSFLAEVEETTQNPRGIQFLQNKLIRDILEQDREDPSFDERIEDFLDVFHKMKVLIVVDDVEEQSHLHAIVGDRLHWFGLGSRIIVTSKTSGILKGYDLEKARNYMVSELDDGQAFELFCKHAFRMQSSILDYVGFSNRIVNATEKLPLAVEVVGSFLWGKSIQEWEKMEKSMKARMMSSQKTSVGLEEILDICYKELDQQQKDIFLDIACFIPGVDARIASYMWPNCYPSSDCILMPLAKIGENNDLQMHRLLRCLGKRIVNQEGSGDPIGRKFYIQDMEKGMENVEALSFDFTAGDFQSMPDIRFLKLDNAKVSGNFAGAFASLRWLCWQRCPLKFDAFNFVLRELVILDLSWSKVTEDWGGWTEIKMEKLKVLNLTGCSDLPITPNFSGYKDLEILILERCSRLVKLDPSIGHLKRLVSLNLKFCSRFFTLPDELGCLTALKELFIDGTSVREIPISIGNLKQLEILSGFKCFPLTDLPSSICNLTALTELSLDGAKVSELPSSLGELLKLRRLSLRDCRYLEKLPYSIGEMGSLEELDISATSISELPNSIRNLKSLRVLRMDSSFIRAFPGEIGNLTKLEELYASWCRSLKGAIPGDIKGLHRLRSLTLGHSSISSLPPEIFTVSGLHTLDLIQCNEIEDLPELPPSLICLRVSSKRMKVIPLLEDLKELEELCLSDGDRPPSKQPMPESNVKQMIDKPSFSIWFPKLRKLELSLSQVIKLKFEPTGIPQRPILPGLSLKEVSELPKTLSVVKLYHSAIEKIEGLERLKALKRLDISNCKIQNLNGIGWLTSLRSLILSDCDYLDSLPDLSNLKLLTVLEIRQCKMIYHIEGLEELTSLEKLNISECPAENSVQAQNALEHVMARSVKRWGSGDFIKQGATSLKRIYREEIPLDTSNKRMKKMEVEAGERAADMETSDRNYAIAAVQNVAGIDDSVEEITNLPEMEVDDESMEKIKDEAGQQLVDMETSDRNYAIAAVQNVVGIDDRAKQITDLLEMEVNDEVRIIGIYGTDGIGKTTLAKAVYKRISSCFDSCSFLAEVEETTQNASGIQFLQNKLIRDILEHDREDPSFDERIADFLDVFREMKVLIVVDDVEEQSHLHAIVGDQLHWFGPGSRIIVTSKNNEILKGYDLEKARNYMVSELDDGQAFELFCKHAFGMQFSIPDYDGFSNRIVNAAEKLPLAVEVAGSFLRGKSIQEWEKMEKSMKARMMSSQKTTVCLEEMLDICYEALDPKQKHIFLDIAGFISGVDAQIASYMWPNCLSPSSGCILMPLAKIGENNELLMHRLLRFVGQRILNQKGSGDPIRRKFYIPDMVPKATSREKGMENVEAPCIDLDDHDSCKFTAGDFESMPDKTFLKLDNAKVFGDFTGAFPSVKWLSWQRCPPNFSAENFVLRELVILDLSWSKVREDWGGWSEIKMEKLKVLNLTGCSDLLITPNFSGYKYLEILILEQCSRLVKLDPSIGHLKRLVSLNLKFCSQLNGLPVELGCLTALKELFIDGTSVWQIPISIGNLKQLEILSGLKCFSLTHLPSSISYLTALTELSLDGAKVSELPSSLGELLKLRRLSLRDCRYLEKLPYSIGEMGSLEELDISATSISELPNSIRNLKSLKVLRMDSSFIRAFPREIGNLNKLEELYASWCRSLKGAIPGDIEGLHRLRSLTLGHSGISSLPPEISTIPGLHTLDLIRCNEIEELPKLPPSLICLRVSSKRMKALPILKGLKELEELCLSDGDPKARRPPSVIEEIEGLEGLKALKRLEISNCKIRNLNGIGQLTSLSSLILSDCDCLDSLPDLSNLKSLKVLEIRRCKMIHQIEGLEELTSLENLKISECPAENSEQVQNKLKDVRARSTFT
ncbi:uncharacterized protein LOC115685312 isoform X2 [Syzygium oleosum]|uniref:uncharacterized protein LOC115685312 isoform X2 n=1 Tax=Syzygium oleosum TaxID=219896 RepID=UPI0024BA284E|nr:uncharacterized protein LOC115685312 isoform X2 [Syzygium oleosum]